MQSSTDTTSVADLTQACLSKFEHLLMQNGLRGNESVQGRLADFNLWVDSVGAIAKPGASLDSRFRGRPDDLALVKSILSMLADFLGEYLDGVNDSGPTEEGLTGVDSCIRNLAMIGVAIRRTGKASRSRRADQSLNLDEHQSFKRHLECIILLRPRDDRLSDDRSGDDQPRSDLLDTSKVEVIVASRIEELASSNLNDLQRRLIEANLRRRHRFLLAQKRSQRVREGKKSEKQLDILAEPSLESRLEEASGPGKTEIKVLASHSKKKSNDGRPMPPPTVTGFSTASTAEGTLRFNLLRRYQSTPTVARSQISLIAAEADFPKRPFTPPDRFIFKCPCCCQSLPSEEFADPGRWKQHLIDDLCPYTCIADHCPTPHLLFATRKAWEIHVERDHSPQWQCPLCDGLDAIFLTKGDIIDHIQAQHQEDLSSHSLSSLVSWSAVQYMGIRSCPLCSSHGPQDSPELIDHVVRHAYEFALRALPWTSLPIEDLDKPIVTFSLPEDETSAQSLEAWLDELDSDPLNKLQLPSFDRTEAKSVTQSISDSAEDDTYFAENDYFDDQSSANLSKSHSVQARSSRAWSQSSNSNTYTDVIIEDGHDDKQAQLLVAAENGDFAVAKRLLDEGVNINSNDYMGRTALFKAAENGQRAMVELLLDRGANARLESYDGRTPFSRAKKRGYDSIVELLLLRSANDDSKDKQNKKHSRFLKPYDIDLEDVSPQNKKLGKDWHANFNLGVQRVLDVALEHTLVHSSVVCSVSFSHDGRYIATGCNRSALIFDVRNGEKVCELEQTNDYRSDCYARSVRFSPDGLYLAIANEDASILVWDIASETIFTRLLGHEAVVSSIDFANDGRAIASGSDDKTVRIWDVEQEAHVHTFALPDGVTSISISPDSRLVVASINGKTMYIIDIKNSSQVLCLNGHRDSIYSVSFLSNGEGLITGSLDKTIKMWKLTKSDGVLNGECVRTLEGHSDFVITVTQTPNAEWVLSGSKDRTVQFWDAETGITQLLLIGHSNSVISVACSPQGGYFATASGDMKVRIWSYSPYDAGADGVAK